MSGHQGQSKCVIKDKLGNQTLCNTGEHQSHYDHCLNLLSCDVHQSDLKWHFDHGLQCLQLFQALSI